MTRVDPPYAADEREMLIAFLDFQRESMLEKITGLTEKQARWSPAESANSLIALVQHLGYVENWWFRVCFAGQADVNLLPDDRTVDDVVAFYRSEWELANDIIRSASSLDLPAVYTKRKDGIPTLRWILNHMIEETARHAGHADITRELIDGATGV